MARCNPTRLLGNCPIRYHLRITNRTLNQFRITTTPSTRPSPALIQHLAALRECAKCPHMIGPPVVGRPANHGILLIGQAPGDKEPKFQRPFAWTAGKTLFQWFQQSLGWSEDETRDHIYFSAVCRCFPGKHPIGGDRVPSSDEILRCRPWLEAEFALLRPRLILPVGKLALATFLPPQPLAEMIGRRFRVKFAGQQMDCIPLPHPSGVSRWPRVEPGKTLLQHALDLIATHPAVVKADSSRRKTAAMEGCHPPSRRGKEP